MQDAAIALMHAFAERTGLGADVPPRRYLWTDAFAVRNLLELRRRTGDERYAALAADLIAQVHRILGRHRGDDGRSGWLSGLSEDEGALHPTAGGLRIGKPLPERRLDEPWDERLEWDRDGQYFHYLTKWIDALGHAAGALGEASYQAQAIELAEAAYSAFLQRSRSGVPQGLAWKMSIDLSRPLVPGLSPHDALDGYVTFKTLTASRGEPGPLGEALGVLWTLVEGQSWGTTDPLGLGGLLLDAARLASLPALAPEDGQLIGRILAGVAGGLRGFLTTGGLAAPAEHRLAFRELGLAIGLQALGTIAAAGHKSAPAAAGIAPYLPGLQSAAPVGARIVAFWSVPGNRRVATWQDHQDINEVMLATAQLEALARLDAD